MRSRHGRARHVRKEPRDRNDGRGALLRVASRRLLLRQLLPQGLLALVELAEGLLDLLADLLELRVVGGDALGVGLGQSRQFQQGLVELLGAAGERPRGVVDVRRVQLVLVGPVIGKVI